jgi:hypothetical protein
MKKVKKEEEENRHKVVDKVNYVQYLVMVKRHDCSTAGHAGWDFTTA